MEFKRTEKLKELINSRNNNLIKIITGVRRCGKSYLLNTIFKNYLLLTDEYDENHIISFSFDKEEDIDKLRELGSKEKIKKINKKTYLVNSTLFRKYISLKTKKNEKYVFLFDEIQYLEDFVGTLNSYLDKPNIDVYVTGSNSRFLSSDIATEFRGRGDIIHLTPLTYKEIYDEIGGDKQQLLDDYFLFGGLPLCVLSKTNEKKISYLNTVFEATYKKDVFDKIKAKNEKQLNELINILSSNIGSLINTERIKNTFKSAQHMDINANTIDNYLSLLSDAFLIKEAKRYDVKGRKYISTPSKFYFTDLGIRNAIINFRQIEKTHLMENLIYNELISRGYNVDVGSVSLYEKNKTETYSKKSLEIDFVVNKGFEKFYIQSCYSIEDADKLEQEEKSLKCIQDNFKKIIVVYENTLPHYNENGYFIVSLLDFLLDYSVLN